MPNNGVPLLGFEALFKHRPRYRPDALEAVRRLPKSVDRHEVHRVLAAALKDQEKETKFARVLERDVPAYRRELESALRALNGVRARFDEHYTPTCLLETIDVLRHSLAPFARGQRTGRKRMDHYQRGLQNLRSLGVNRTLATSMLRAIIPIPGPPPAG